MLKFISETNGIYKRNYLLRMDIVEKVFEVISCIKLLANDIKIYQIDQNYLFRTTVTVASLICFIMSLWHASFHSGFNQESVGMAPPWQKSNDCSLWPQVPGK